MGLRSRQDDERRWQVVALRSFKAIQLSDVYVNIMNNTTRRHETHQHVHSAGSQVPLIQNAPWSTPWGGSRQKQTQSRCVTIQARGSRKRKRTRLLQA